mmetsp:Transcript_29075/g.86055  ORF Transcript_29075/g.86055 Transcript_29075/m.86055 type:complete len:498 (+) Transcript_29075:415-1908(+)
MRGADPLRSPELVERQARDLEGLLDGRVVGGRLGARPVVPRPPHARRAGVGAGVQKDVVRHHVGPRRAVPPPVLLLHPVEEVLRLDGLGPVAGPSPAVHRGRVAQGVGAYRLVFASQVRMLHEFQYLLGLSGGPLRLGLGQGVEGGSVRSDVGLGVHVPQLVVIIHTREYVHGSLRSVSVTRFRTRVQEGIVNDNVWNDLSPAVGVALFVEDGLGDAGCIPLAAESPGVHNSRNGAGVRFGPVPVPGFVHALHEPLGRQGRRLVAPPREGIDDSVVAHHVWPQTCLVLFLPLRAPPLHALQQLQRPFRRLVRPSVPQRLKDRVVRVQVGPNLLVPRVGEILHEPQRLHGPLPRDGPAPVGVHVQQRVEAPRVGGGVGVRVGAVTVVHPLENPLGLVGALHWVAPLTETLHRPGPQDRGVAHGVELHGGIAVGVGVVQLLHLRQDAFGALGGVRFVGGGEAPPVDEGVVGGRVGMDVVEDALELPIAKLVQDCLGALR